MLASLSLVRKKYVLVKQAGILGAVFKRKALMAQVSRAECEPTDGAAETPRLLGTGPEITEV